jgi:hypothetical protein
MRDVIGRTQLLLTGKILLRKFDGYFGFGNQGIGATRIQLK